MLTMIAGRLLGLDSKSAVCSLHLPTTIQLTSSCDGNRLVSLVEE